jgi:hypothetical protein
MDMVQVLIVDAGWVFFAAWGTTLAAFGIIAFGRDILSSEQSTKAKRTVIGSGLRYSDPSPKTSHPRPLA